VTTKLAYAWGPGELPLLLPSSVGSPLGGSDVQSFQIKIHCNNPNRDAGVLDSGGVRFYYTSRKRQYDLGVFQAGDPFVVLNGQSVGVAGTNNAMAQHTFTCPSSCSSNVLSRPVTALREHLHMPKSGVSMANVQIRNGQELRRGTVQYWDFDQQGGFGVVQSPFTIQPGDSFRTVCNYNPQNGERFGLGSGDEMFHAFIAYYPRQTYLGVEKYLPGCGATHEDVVVTNATMLFR
jgi:Copper type II ascorbate-dependent monooxygenase, C-terminal domain